MKSKRKAVDRRGFLKGAAVGAAALAVNPAAAVAQPQPMPADPPRLVPPPMLPEAEVGTPSSEGVLTVDRTGSDFMVDVIKSLGIRVRLRQSGIELPRACTNRSSTTAETRAPNSSPAATRNRRWPWRTATPRSKASRRWCSRTAPSGLQHASMAIYNAYCDRVPVYLIIGNILDATTRRPGVGVGSQRAGCRGDGARFHEVGRHAGFAARTSPSPPCAPTKSR